MPLSDGPARDLMAHRLTSRRSTRASLGLVALGGIVAYLVAVPLGVIVWASLRGAPFGVDTHLTVANYTQALTSPTLHEAILNTAVFGIASTLLACTIGIYLAWVTERTDAAWRWAIRALAVLPVAIPSILTTIAWTLVLNTRIGIGNAALELLLGREVAVFNAASMPAMIWIQGTDSITLPFLLTAAAMRSMDSSLEESSTIAGATRWTTLRRVTLPLMAPATLAAAMLVFISTIGSFAVPAAVGLPAGIRVLATEVYVATRSFPTNTNVAATYAVIYAFIALGALVLYHRAVRRTGTFTTVGGRSGGAARIRLGRSGAWHTSMATGILAVIVVIPLGVMIYASVLPYYTPPRREIWSRLTFDNYRWVLFESATIERAVINNIVSGAGAAVVVVLLGTMIAWLVARSSSPMRRVIDVIAAIPVALPGLVIALAIMWVYLLLPVPIYATLWIIVIAFVTAYLPYAVRTSHATIANIGGQLEEASQIAGATWFQTFRRIVLPLISAGLFVGFVYVFARTFKSLSLPVLLAGPGNEVVPVLIFDLYQEGQYPRLNALGVLLSVFLLVVFVGIQQASARRRSRSVRTFAADHADTL